MYDAVNEMADESVFVPLDEFCVHARKLGVRREQCCELLLRFHDLGALVWLEREGVKDLVLLQPQRIAVAMQSLIYVRFRHEGGLRHAKSYVTSVESRLRGLCAAEENLREQGVASEELLRALWHGDFTEKEQQVLLQMLEEHRLLIRQPGADHGYGGYVIPMCLEAVDPPSQKV